MNTNHSSRVAWMSREGAQIYETWTFALLDTCDTPSFWSEYKDRVANDPEIDSQEVPNIDNGFRRLLGRTAGLMNEIDAEIGISRKYLAPYTTDILRYTSAMQIGQKEKLNDPATIATAHAMDGLDFAVKFSAGMANDTFLAEYAPDAASRELTREEASRKLEFVTEALANRSFIGCLQEMRISGFAVLGDQAITQIETIPMEGGWFGRAHQLGYKRFSWDIVLSGINHDAEADRFAVKPEVLTHLRSRLHEQNIHGIPHHDNTAGPLVELSLPISRGCPVREAIGKVSVFASRACSVLAE